MVVVEIYIFALFVAFLNIAYLSEFHDFIIFTQSQSESVLHHISSELAKYQEILGTSDQLGIPHNSCMSLV